MRGRESRVRAAREEEGGFRPTTIAVLFAVLTAMASIPIATHPLPPLADYINHLSRTYVIDAVGADADLARFYTVDWQLIPNLMIDLVVPLLHRFMDIYLAGQVFTVLAFMLTVSGTLALNRALNRRWSALPLIATPLLYNGVLLVGVMNYIFGIGLALWSLAAWIALRERPWPWRYAASALFALALFFCHLYAVGLYGLGLLAFELHRLWTRRAHLSPALLAEFAAAGLPFVPLALPLLAGPTWHVPGAAAYWELGGKLEGLWTVVDVYHRSVSLLLLAMAGAAAAYAWLRGWLRFHPAGWAILAVCGIAFLVMPRSLFGAYLADQRLPIAAAFMLIACFSLDLPTRAARLGLVALIAALLIVRVAEVQTVWNRLDRGTNEFVQSVKSIKRGARILVVHGDRSNVKEISDFNLMHAASLATIEKSALVSTAFTVKGKHILHARKAYLKFVETQDRRPPSLPNFVLVAERAAADGSYFWNLWPQHFDYVYVLFTTPGMPNPQRRHLSLVYEGSAFRLYRVLAQSAGR
jgi:hypothetical protein